VSRVESPSGKNYDEHYDEETIALLALGETVAGVQTGHLRSCGACQAQIDQLQAVVDSARAITDDDRPIAPPDALWQRITDEIESDGPVPGSRNSQNSGNSRNEHGKAAPPRSSGWMGGSGWSGKFALAAAVGVLVGSLGTIVAMDRENPPSMIAQAELQPLPGKNAQGVAQVRQTAEGATLVVDVPGLPQTDGYYEVWMLAPDAESMVSIGILGGGEVNEFPLPEGMDMNRFPVVDISVEQFDGDVTHSADSVVRGELTT